MTRQRAAPTTAAVAVLACLEMARPALLALRVKAAPSCPDRDRLAIHFSCLNEHRDCTELDVIK